MAAPPFSDVYLEAVEESQNQSGEPEEVGNAGLAGFPKWKLTHRLLGDCRRGILTHTISNKRLAQAGYFSILDRYESLHLYA